MSQSTIINGFVKCGLHPFNADAIDYGQLIKKGKLNDNQDESSDQLLPNEIPNLFLTQFESRLDPNKLKEFKQSKPQWQGDICDVSLFEYWRKVGGRINSDVDSNSVPLCGSNDIVFEYIDAPNEGFNLNAGGEIINLDFDGITEVIVTHDETTDYARIDDALSDDDLSDDTLNGDERTDDERTEYERSDDEGTDEEHTINEPGAEQIDQDASTTTTIVFPSDFVPVQETIVHSAVTSVNRCDSSDQGIPKIPNFSSVTNTGSSDPANCFRDLLFWPGRNPTSGKPGSKRKKEKVKIPAVLTSEDAMNYLKSKEAEKERLEAEKIERKKQRELKKEEKQKNEIQKNKQKEERKKQMLIKAELQKAYKQKREEEILEKKQRIAAKKAGQEAAKKLRDGAKRRKQEQEEKFMAAFEKHLVS